MRSLGIVIDARASSRTNQSLSLLPFCKEPHPHTKIAGLKRLEHEEAKQLESLLQKELAMVDGLIGLTTRQYTGREVYSLSPPVTYFIFVNFTSKSNFQAKFDFNNYKLMDVSIFWLQAVIAICVYQRV